MKIDVLAVGAHPDDIELACGGTIAKLVKQGYSVALADVTQGELGTRGTKEIRAKEAQKAAEILGVKTRRNLHVPDGNVEVNKRNVQKLIVLIRELKPTMMIIPHSVERHPDHVNTHHLAKQAWYYAGLRKLKTSLGGSPQESFRPHHYFEFMQWHEFNASFIVDITDSYDKKMESVRAHTSQFFDPRSKEPPTKLSTPEFLENIETRAKYYGQRIGVKYGEPFLTNYSLGVSDMFDLIIHKR
ncbi:MAG TPA: bacillithiol biosynthesis deacetylase BshB1 [Bacteroidota bacterium]|nr:bacillithiol biosynthesis deacetylase BshB1 [Bacteroidota bacterium]